MVCFFSSASVAHSYQFELSGALAHTELSSDNFSGNVEVDSTAIEGRFYLRPVNESSGPLFERAFLDKAASIGLSYGQAEPEDGNNTDTIGVDARFVTLSNTVFEARYSTTEPPVGDELNEYRLGAGKYTEDRTLILGTFSRVESGSLNLDTLSVTGRKLNTGGNADTFIAYEGNIDFLIASNDFDDENGFGLGWKFTYYPSLQLGLGAGFSFRDIDGFDVTTFGVDLTYFLNESIFTTAGFQRSNDSADIDTDILALGIAFRF